MTRGVILDRDGTLIDFVRDPELGVVTPAFHPDQIRFLPGALAGLKRLSRAGYRLAIATNQPDAAKGRVPRSAIRSVNRRLLNRLDSEGLVIDRLEVCLHHPEPHDGGDPALTGPCLCRKPQPAMLERIVEALALRRADSWMIGDTASDLGAAAAAGLRCALVMHRDRCELCPLRGASLRGAAPALRAPRLDLLAEEIIGR